jgi:hypothetical protein
MHTKPPFPNGGGVSLRANDGRELPKLGVTITVDSCHCAAGRMVITFKGLTAHSSVEADSSLGSEV